MKLQTKFHVATFIDPIVSFSGRLRRHCQCHDGRMPQDGFQGFSEDSHTQHSQACHNP